MVLDPRYILMLIKRRPLCGRFIGMIQTGARIMVPGWFLHKLACAIGVEVSKVWTPVFWLAWWSVLKSQVVCPGDLNRQRFLKQAESLVC